MIIWCPLKGQNKPTTALNDTLFRTIFRIVGDVCKNKNPHAADEYVGVWLKEVFYYMGCAEGKLKLLTTGGLKLLLYVYVCLMYGFTLHPAVNTQRPFHTLHTRFYFCHFFMLFSRSSSLCLFSPEVSFLCLFFSLNRHTRMSVELEEQKVESPYTCIFGVGLFVSACVTSCFVPNLICHRKNNRIPCVSFSGVISDVLVVSWVICVRTLIHISPRWHLSGTLLSILSNSKPALSLMNRPAASRFAVFSREAALHVSPLKSRASRPHACSWQWPVSDQTSQRGAFHWTWGLEISCSLLRGPACSQCALTDHTLIFTHQWESPVHVFSSLSSSLGKGQKQDFYCAHPVCHQHTAEL